MNKFEKIIAECKLAIDQDSNDFESLTKWMEAVKQLANPDKALLELQNVIDKTIHTAHGYNSFGNLFYDLGRFNQAIEQYKKAIELDPAYVVAYNNRGLALRSLGKYEEALTQYLKATELEPTNPDVFNNIGNALYDLKKYEEAIAQYIKAIELDSNFVDAYNNRGLALKNLRRYEEAIAQYTKAIELDPNYADAYNNWGDTLYKLGKYEDAIAQYTKAIELDANYVDAYNNLGLALKSLGKNEEAIIQYSKAIELDATYKYAYNNLGNAFYDLGKYDEAIVQYTKAIELDVTYKYAYNNWGLALYNLKKNEEAIEQFKKAIGLDLSYVDAYNNLGLALNNLGENEEAIEQYKKAIEIDDNFKLAYENLGWILIKIKRNADAIVIFEKASAKGIADNPIYFGWAYALENSGMFNEAFEKYEKAADCDKDDAYSVHNIAALLEKQGCYKEAAKYWLRACSIYEKNKDKEWKNKNADYFLYYGSIFQYSNFKDLNRAETIYTKGLELNPENTGILFNLIQLYQSNRCEKTEKTEIKGHECVQAKAYSTAMEYFRRAKAVLEGRINKTKSADTLVELGNLYKELGIFEDAEMCFTEALTLDIMHIPGLTNLGAVYMHNEKYKKAIATFEKAKKLDPYNFDLRSNLAEAYLKAGKIEEAEKEYREILAIIPFHMDSLIGIAQTYITMGEKACEKKDDGNAEVMFSTAEDYFCKILHLIQNPENASKILNRNEQSAVFYSKGYNEVMIYEIQNRKDLKRLKTAEQDFKKVSSGTANYYKAQRAIAKTTERLRPSQDVVKKWGSRLILCFLIAVFMINQLFFSLGKPVLGFSGYVVNKDKIEELIPLKKQVDLSVIDKLKSMANEKSVFQSMDGFYNSMKAEFGDSTVSVLKHAEVLEGAGNITIKSFQPVDSVLYILITFGSLLFMIAGFYLDQISKLKVGAIELEKSTINQISTTSSLGISK
jgi:tetratricopeptide (TPR) repeat protein